MPRTRPYSWAARGDATSTTGLSITQTPAVRPAEAAELEALRDLAAAAPPGLVETRESGGAFALRVDGIVLRETTRILGLYDIAALDELAHLYGSGEFWVQLDPAAGLEQELGARGFEPDYAWQKFERGVEPYEAPTDLRIAEADERLGGLFSAAYGAPPELGAWFGRILGRPGWHALGAYDGELLVASGALWARDGLGWVGFGATLPSHRGRGAQAALLAARIDRAAELGVTMLVTETGVAREGRPGPSYRNLLRAGFAPVYERPNFRLAGTAG